MAQLHRDKDSAAVELGRKGGLIGGHARAAALTPEMRKQIAQKAANKRWGKASGIDDLAYLCNKLILKIGKNEVQTSQDKELLGQLYEILLKHVGNCPKVG